MIQGYVVARTLETTEVELMHTVFPHPTVSETMHEAVLDAIAAGDEAAARTAIRHHLSQSILISEKLREARPEYFSHNVQPSDRRPDSAA